MSLGIKKTTGTSYAPVFQQILERLVGGGTLKTGTVPSYVREIREGTPIAADASTPGLFNICKRGVPLATTTATGKTYKVNANNYFKVGEFLMKAGGSTASTITAITRSGVTDTITVGTCIGTLTTNSRLYAATGAGTSATSPLYSPSALLADTVQVRYADYATMPNVLIAGVVRGTVDESRLPNPLKASDKTALTDRIRFA